MRFGDRLLQRWRIRKARPFIPHRGRVLDIGCAEGSLFRQLDKVISEGIGMDPHIDRSQHFGKFRLIAGEFPRDLPNQEPFDAITMLAVLEHIPREAQKVLARNCATYLKPGGNVIITVPSPAVDTILAWLKRMRVVDGMSLEEHYGFTPRETIEIFTGAGLRLVKGERFQFGLNNLYVFQKA